MIPKNENSIHREEQLSSKKLNNLDNQANPPLSNEYTMHN